MRFLVDAQLPPGLARYLASRGHEAEHVYDIGMGSAPDREVWDHAVRNNAVLVTKDDDFVTFKTMGKGGGPPVVWVRLGNTTNRELFAHMDRYFKAIIDLLQSGEELVEMGP